MNEKEVGVSVNHVTTSYQCDVNMKKKIVIPYQEKCFPYRQGVINAISQGTSKTSFIAPYVRLATDVGDELKPV